MEELPETLKAEIEALDSLDARALKRRYADIVADMPKCALSSVLRATIAYRLQERHYGQSLSKEATEWLDEAADDKRMFPDGRKVGSGARFVRFWKGERYETTVRDDGRYEYNGEIYGDWNFLSPSSHGGVIFYYLNRNSNDRNLEWDMKNNLCPNPGGTWAPKP